MPGVLKSLMAKLKHRRKSKSWQNRVEATAEGKNGGVEETAVTGQMADLSLEDSVTGMADSKTTAPTSHVFGKEDFDFDFDFHSTEHAWPGPSYDEHALFAPGSFDKPRHPKRRSKEKSSKRRVSHDECFISHKPPDRSEHKQAKAIPRTKKPPPKPQYYGSPPARDPPLHLLTLPGEIRNQIYRLLCVHDEPVVAQFRLIIRPKQGRKKKPGTYCRFPREPVPSLVCRQLQRETLSIFYGENRFLFRKSDNPRMNAMHNAPPTMTRPESFDMWAPRFGFAASLTHLEVQFRAREPTFKTFHISYTFRKLAEGGFSIAVNSGGTECCMCFEGRARSSIEGYLQETAGGESLVAIARKFTDLRRDKCLSEASLNADFPYTVYRPDTAICDECACERLVEVGSGL